MRGVAIPEIEERRRRQRTRMRATWLGISKVIGSLGGRVISVLSLDPSSDSAAVPALSSFWNHGSSLSRYWKAQVWRGQPRCTFSRYRNEDGEADWGFVYHLDIDYGRPVQGRCHYRR